MVGRVLIRWRRLPDGEPHHALEVGREGRYLELASAGAEPVYPPGALVEIESDSLVYMGEVLQHKDRNAIVQLEHCIDAAKAAAARDIWS